MLHLELFLLHELEKTMSTGVLRGSLVSRLIVVSRKPHGVKSRVSERMSVSLYA